MARPIREILLEAAAEKSAEALEAFKLHRLLVKMGDTSATYWLNEAKRFLREAATIKSIIP